MPTKKELTDQLTKVSREACAYQEAFWALQRGDKPIKLTSGEKSIELLAPHRMCGGVVVDGSMVRYADDWIANAHTVDPYIRDLAHQIRRHQSEALNKVLDEAEAGGRTPRSLRLVAAE